jgi:hypothetical protein
MTDRAEDLMDTLETVCAAMGLTVERDRVLPVQQNQAPLVVLRTGEELLEPGEKATLLTCGVRWQLRASVEHYVAAGTPAANRTALNAAWSAFRVAFFASPVIRGDMLANGTLPDLARSLNSPSSDPKIAGQVFEVAFIFNRTN